MPGSGPLYVSEAKILLFSEYGHVAYQIKGNYAFSNMVANILHADGSKGQNSTFSEHSHVAYQIKGNHECSNIQAHILSLHTPSTTGVGQRSKHVFS